MGDGFADEVGEVGADMKGVGVFGLVDLNRGQI